MPRSARIDAPGVLNHFIIRGIERRKIFYDAADQNNFVDRQSALVPETQTACYAWVLMNNHAHFLFRSGPAGIAKLMPLLKGPAPVDGVLAFGEDGGLVSIVRSMLFAGDELSGGDRGVATEFDGQNLKKLGSFSR